MSCNTFFARLRGMSLGGDGLERCFFEIKFLHRWFGLLWLHLGLSSPGLPTTTTHPLPCRIVKNIYQIRHKFHVPTLMVVGVRKGFFLLITKHGFLNMYLMEGAALTIQFRVTGS